MIHPERITPLNRQPARKGRFVLYWMQASQRVACNHALEYAVGEEMACTLPDVVFRRTGMGTVGQPGEEAVRRAAAVMGGML